MKQCNSNQTTPVRNQFHLLVIRLGSSRRSFKFADTTDLNGQVNYILNEIGRVLEWLSFTVHRLIHFKE